MNTTIYETALLLKWLKTLAEKNIIEDNLAAQSMQIIYKSIDPKNEWSIDTLLKSFDENEKFYFAGIKPNAIIPTKETENAGYDIYACFEDDYIFIEPNTTKLIPTGIASALPEDYYFQIQERGSSGSKGIKYSAGVIDASYRGEWFLAVTNCNNHAVIISKLSKNELIEKIRKVRLDSKFSYINTLPTQDGYKKVSDNLQEEIIYPYNKAIFQAVLHKVHNNISPQTISYEGLLKIKSERGDGKLGSSNK